MAETEKILTGKYPPDSNEFDDIHYDNSASYDEETDEIITYCDKKRFKSTCFFIFGLKPINVKYMHSYHHFEYISQVEYLQKGNSVIWTDGSAECK